MKQSIIRKIPVSEKKKKKYRPKGLLTFNKPTLWWVSSSAKAVSNCLRKETNHLGSLIAITQRWDFGKYP